jgi:hypothetical protein
MRPANWLEIKDLKNREMCLELREERQLACLNFLGKQSRKENRLRDLR